MFQQIGNRYDPFDAARAGHHEAADGAASHQIRRSTNRRRRLDGHHAFGHEVANGMVLPERRATAPPYETNATGSGGNISTRVRDFSQPGLRQPAAVARRAQIIGIITREGGV